MGCLRRWEYIDGSGIRTLQALSHLYLVIGNLQEPPPFSPKGKDGTDHISYGECVEVSTDSARRITYAKNDP